MPIVPTALLLTPHFDAQKQLTIVGGAAVNERVAVTIINVEDVASSGLVLRLMSRCGRIEYARFPSLDTDEWTVTGTDTTCSLNLNTSALHAAFRRHCSGDTLGVDVYVENGTTDNLYARGTMQIANWPQNPLDPVAEAYTLQGQIDALTERIETHQHDADVEGESAFPHNNLTDRDATGAHPAIEGAIDNTNLNVATNAANIATLTGRLNTLATAASPASPITELNADDDQVLMSAVFSAIRSLIAFANSLKGGLQ